MATGSLLGARSSGLTHTPRNSGPRFAGDDAKRRRSIDQRRCFCGKHSSFGRVASPRRLLGSLSSPPPARAVGYTAEQLSFNRLIKVRFRDSSPFHRRSIGFGRPPLPHGWTTHCIGPTIGCGQRRAAMQTRSIIHAIASVLPLGAIGYLAVSHDREAQAIARGPVRAGLATARRNEQATTTLRKLLLKTSCRG